MDTVRWGILGAGNIAHAFAAGLAVAEGAELAAVGSRDGARAEAFAGRYGAARAHGSYEALVADAGVDAVYVATPHVFHHAHTLLALEHGKAVLCEKPLALNAREAEAMAAAARSRGLFLMEAMWTRLLPHVTRALELVASGAIGEVRQLTADFGFRSEVDPASRLFDPALGGGSLLDVGVYPLWLAQALFGEPLEVASLANLGATGVDEEAAVVLRHARGQLALLFSAVRLRTPHEATLVGTEGHLRLLPPWWKPSAVLLHRAGREPERIAPPALGNGYAHEILEVGRCLREGRLESPALPLAGSLAVARTMDRLRALWGLGYPTEAA